MICFSFFILKLFLLKIMVHRFTCFSYIGVPLLTKREGETGKKTQVQKACTSTLLLFQLPFIYFYLYFYILYLFFLSVDFQN